MICDWDEIIERSSIGTVLLFKHIDGQKDDEIEIIKVSKKIYVSRWIHNSSGDYHNEELYFGGKLNVEVVDVIGKETEFNNDMEKLLGD